MQNASALRAVAVTHVGDERYVRNSSSALALPIRATGLDENLPLPAILGGHIYCCLDPISNMNRS